MKNLLFLITILISSISFGQIIRPTVLGVTNGTINKDSLLVNPIIQTDPNIQLAKTSFVIHINGKRTYTHSFGPRLNQKCLALIQKANSGDKITLGILSKPYKGVTYNWVMKLTLE